MLWRQTVMHPNTALIKTTIYGIGKLKKLLAENPGILIISSTEYIKWKLGQNNIESVRLNSFSHYKNYLQLERTMSKKYAKLCSSKDETFDYVDLFRNHLCWEMQKSFFFLSAVNAFVSRKNVKTIYLEDFIGKNIKRYSRPLNDLFYEYFSKKGIDVKIF